MSKTIFITSFHTLISRNILQTRLLEWLARDCRVVILVPDFKKDYFEKNFGRSNVVIEGVPVKLERHDLLFRQLALAFSKTKTLDIKKRSDFFEDRKFFSFLTAYLPAQLLGNFSWPRRLLQFLDYRLAQAAQFQPLFEHYQPLLVFAADIQNELDVRVVQAAKKFGIRTLGMTRSWDNLTAKGIVRALPDALVVQNEIIKTEAVRYNNFPAEKIFVVGIPHYDRYLENFNSQTADKNFSEARENFFQRHNFDLKKPLIVVAPAGDRYIRRNSTDKTVVAKLVELDANILVRVPPGDSSDFSGLPAGRAKIFFDNSGTSYWRGGRKLNELGREDDKNLFNALHWADVVVAHLATMCVDAAFFDKPVVTIAFDAEPRPYLDSIRKYFDYDHLQPIIKSGGLRIARQADQLIPLVREYLARPALDQDGRQRLVSQQVQFLDGLATERLLEVIRRQF